MRCELGGVEEHGNATFVGGDGDLVDWGRPAGDVGRAGDREEFGAGLGVEGGGDVVGGEGPVGGAVDEAPAGDARPREQVGVVFDDGGEDDVVGVEAEPVGEVVDGFGGVAADDRDVGVGCSPGESEDRGTCVFVGVGGGAGLVAGAAMHARVPGDEVVHPGGDGWQRVG